MADKTTHFGRAGEYFVISELLLRGWNVAIPVVDVGRRRLRHRRQRQDDLAVAGEVGHGRRSSMYRRRGTNGRVAWRISGLASSNAASSEGRAQGVDML
jgi:hypothetical protein